MYYIINWNPTSKPHIRYTNIIYNLSSFKTWIYQPSLDLNPISSKKELSPLRGNNFPAFFYMRPWNKYDYSRRSRDLLAAYNSCFPSFLRLNIHSSNDIILRYSLRHSLRSRQRSDNKERSNPKDNGFHGTFPSCVVEATVELKTSPCVWAGCWFAYVPRSTILRRRIGSRKRPRCRIDRRSSWRPDDPDTRIASFQRVSRVRCAPSESTDSAGIPFQSCATVRDWDEAVSWLVPRRCRCCCGKTRRSETSN